VLVAFPIAAAHDGHVHFLASGLRRDDESGMKEIGAVPHAGHFIPPAPTFQSDTEAHH
jgi:hypothetical protein